MSDTKELTLEERVAELELEREAFQQVLTDLQDIKQIMQKMEGAWMAVRVLATIGAALISLAYYLKGLSK